MNLSPRYFLLSQDHHEIATIGAYDDYDIARIAAHVMSLADPFATWSVFDRWEQKIVSQWSAMPANENWRAA